jgi:adenosylcobinamide kinase/adenosylcobinamide-phosphate guanylyltransferase
MARKAGPQLIRPPAMPATVLVGQDGRVPDLEPGAPARHRVLVLGGARSGKSRYAEELLSGAASVRYVATATVSGDAEWAERIAAHRARRPAGWTTVETTDVARELRAGGVLLVECMTLWLMAAIDEARAWPGEDACPCDRQARAALDQRLDELVNAWQESTARVVAVSNEVGWGVVPATASGRFFRDELGTLNARLAAGAGEVWLLVAGLAQRLR